MDRLLELVDKVSNLLPPIDLADSPEITFDIIKAEDKFIASANLGVVESFKQRCHFIGRHPRDILVIKLHVFNFTPRRTHTLNYFLGRPILVSRCSPFACLQEPNRNTCHGRALTEDQLLLAHFSIVKMQDRHIMLGRNLCGVVHAEVCFTCS